MTLQPVSITMSPEELRASFVKIKYTEVADARWHFEIALAKGSRVGPGGKAAPVAGGPLVSLALFNRAEPACDVEVFGQELAYEIHPADWLDVWVGQQPFKVLSRMRLLTIAGAIGDLVVQWEVGSAQWMGRIFCMKVGGRLVMIWFRTAAGDYAGLAESMFVTMSNFGLLDTSSGPLAEQVRWVGAKLPMAWKTVVPVSWEVKEEPATEKAGSFQATLRGEGGMVLGNLSFVAAGAGEATAAGEIFEKMFAAAREGGVVMENCVPGPEQAPPPYLQVWGCWTKATVGGQAAEVRCRVMRHARGWIGGLVVMVPRAVSPEAWMRGNRMLDLATGALEIT